MRSFLIFTSICITLVGLGLFHWTRSSNDEETESESEAIFIEDTESVIEGLVDEYANWQRPPGPIKIGLQVGHWKNKELPDEFERLRESGGGTSGGGKAEWEVSLVIAELTAELLRQEGMIVDILPATIPPSYWADVLISLHADGNENSSVSGYKVAAPRRDRTGKAEQLAAILEKEYGKLVNLDIDPNVTRNMRGYYAFNWRRYEYSMHPMTVATIIETGFLTNPRDRKIILSQPELSAQGIANGIKEFLKTSPPV